MNLKNNINKKLLIKYINMIGILVTFILAAVTGILKIPALELGRYIPMKPLTIIHDVSGVVMVFFTIGHIALYWPVVVGMTKAVFKKKE
jgi:cytochrome b subunit of formate dehydrogenase